jgi:hypothetical protein
MPRYFLDSSALVKRYHQESGTAQVEGLFNVAGNRFLASAATACGLPVLDVS